MYLISQFLHRNVLIAALVHVYCIRFNYGIPLSLYYTIITLLWVFPHWLSLAFKFRIVAGICIAANNETESNEITTHSRRHLFKCEYNFIIETNRFWIARQPTPPRRGCWGQSARTLLLLLQHTPMVACERFCLLSWIVACWVSLFWHEGYAPLRMRSSFLSPPRIFGCNCLPGGAPQHWQRVHVVSAYLLASALPREAEA